MTHADAVIESRWTGVDGIQIHARVADLAVAAAGPPIVLVHGLVVSSRYLVPMARTLAPRWRVYVPDLPGYGRSGKPAHALSVVELAEALSGYLRAIEIRPVALVANSFGCQIAAEFAARHPDQLDCLVLLGPTVDPSSRPVPNLAVRWLMNLPLEPPTLDLIALRDLLDAGPRRSYESFRHMMRHHIEHTLPAVQAPTLVVRGERDATVTHDWIERVARLLPRGRVAEIRGAPHTVTYNATEQTANLVDDFIRETRVLRAH